jgi:hypothetical protein
LPLAIGELTTGEPKSEVEEAEVETEEVCLGVSFSLSLSFLSLDDECFFFLELLECFEEEEDLCRFFSLGSFSGFGEGCIGVAGEGAKPGPGDKGNPGEEFE